MSNVEPVAIGDMIRTRAGRALLADTSSEICAMSTIPAKQAPPADPAEAIEERFRRLASIWRTDTAHVAPTTDLVAHPAFQEIVLMGPTVIPLLLLAGGSRPSRDAGSVQ